jgi:UDP-glucose 4-epimerase
MGTGHILVTGGAGFIGSHLVDSLLADGHRVTILDNLSTGHLGNLDAASRSPNFRFVQGSVTDEAIVDELTHECESVVHLAAAVGVRLIVEEP